MCEASPFHHGPRPLVADCHARASPNPARIRCCARVGLRFHCRHSSVRSLCLIQPSSSSSAPFPSVSRKYDIPSPQQRVQVFDHGESAQGATGGPWPKSETFHRGFHQPQRLRFCSPSSHRTSLCTHARSRQVPPAFAAVGRTCVRSCFIGSHRGLLSYARVSRSALRRLATATMASADF